MPDFLYSAYRGGGDMSLTISADSLMNQLAEDITRHGDVERALRQLMQRGAEDADGGKVDGIQDLLSQLRDLRKDMLDRYNLASAYDGMKDRLDRIVEQERDGIRERLDDLRRRLREQPAETTMPGDFGRDRRGDAMDDALLRVAAGNMAALNGLPEDVGGMVQGLRDHEFMDGAARSRFEDLLAELQQGALDALTRDLSKELERLTPQDLTDLERLASDLNGMLEERSAGGEPDLNSFLDRHRDRFGGAPPSSLDQLVENIHRQAGRMQSLLASLPAAQHRGLADLLQSKLLTPGLEGEMQRLMANLRQRLPNRPLGKQYGFHGDDAVSLNEALKLMEQLRRFDDLERHLDRVRYGSPLEEVDRSEVEELLGKPAADALDSMGRMAERLIQAGYALREGDGLGLTARGVRHIGQKAMLDIFRRLRQGGLGNHPSGRRGFGVQMSDETRPYEFGHPFFLHLERTLMRAAARGGGTPVRLQADDFEVYATEHMTQTATVLMLDLSRSMPMRGNAHAAKKVTLALHQLIRTQFPRDNLYVVGFSGIAREVKHEDLPKLESGDFGRGTNMQAGLQVARRLLARHRGGARQVIMVTDGEPTAYYERNGQVYIELPPSPRVLRATLMEVQRCTRDGITINTFMLERTDALRQFVSRLTRMNRGRVFFTGADTLGEYLLVDYLHHKKIMIS
ncbi:MAG: VWA domain-containing protein [Chloroflexi bacterium]|nr:VWA domain-containing protein [Chloroflexota bacterium]